MGSGDISQLQVLANGTCNGVHTALVTTATGAVVATTGAGLYTITVDAGLIGDNSDAAHARVMVTPLSGIAQTNIQQAKSVVAGLLVITLTAFVIGAATDVAFDFIIWRDPAN